MGTIGIFAFGVVFGLVAGFIFAKVRNAAQKGSK